MRNHKEETPTEKARARMTAQSAIYFYIDKYYRFKDVDVSQALRNILSANGESKIENTVNKWRNGSSSVSIKWIPKIIDFVRKQDNTTFKFIENHTSILRYTIESIIKKSGMSEQDKKCILSETNFYQFLRNALEVSYEYKDSLLMDDVGMIDVIGIEKKAIARVDSENGYAVYIFEEYRERIIRSTQYVDFSNGIYAVDDYTGTSLNPVLLKDVYIKQGAYMRNEARNARRAEQEIVKGKGQGDDVEVYKRLGEYLYTENYMNKNYGICVDLQDQIKRNQRIVVLGGPGAGKTTFLRHIANQIVNEEHPDCIPVLISLRKYSETKTVVSFKDFVIESEQSDEIKEWLKNVLNQSKVIWLIDALDEALISAKDIKEQIRNLPKEHKVILTSRPFSYLEEEADNMACYELAPLPYEDSKTIDDFFRGWYGHTGITNVEERLKWMKDQLAKRPNIEQLISNPLLLTFLVILSSEYNTKGFEMKELPYTRSSLYDSFIKFQLMKWEAVKGNTILKEMVTLCSGSKTEANKMAIFGMEEIGWTLHQAYYLSPREELPTHEYIEEKLSVALLEEMDLSKSKTKALGDLIIQLWRNLGIVDVWSLEGHDYLCFRHMTLQEYCVAKYLSRMWKSNKNDAIEYIKRHHFLREMREPILLFTGLKENKRTANEEIVDALLQFEDEFEPDVRSGARISGEILVETAVSQKWKEEGIVSVFDILWSKYTYRPAINALTQLGKTYKFTYIRIQDKAKMHELVALYLLGEIGDREGIDILIDALHRGADLLTRDIALEALIKIKDKRVIAPIIETMDDANLTLRRYAFNGLHRIISEKAILEMREVLLDVHINQELLRIMFNAIRDLYYFPHITDILVELCREEAQHDLKEKVIAYLFEQLKEEPCNIIGGYYHWERNDNYYYLWAIGELSISKLTDIFMANSIGLNLRRSALAALKHLRDERALPAIKMAIYDEDFVMVRYSAAALVEIGTDSAFKELLEKLKNCSQRDACIVTDELWETENPMLLSELKRELTNSKRDIRYRAAEILAQKKDLQAIFILIDALNDHQNDYPYRAAYVLREIGIKVDVKILAKALKDEDRNVRYRGIISIGQSGDESLHGVLADVLDALNDNDWTVRHAVSGILWRRRFVKALPKLIDALNKETDEDVIDSLMRTIVNTLLNKPLSDELYQVAITAVIDAYKRKKNSGKPNAVECLGELGCREAIAALCSDLSSPDEATRMNAARELVQSGNNEGVSTLLNFLGVDYSESNERDTLNFTEFALNDLLNGAFAEMVVTALKGVLNDKNGQVSSSAARLLIRNGYNDETVIAVLRNVIENGHVHDRTNSSDCFGEFIYDSRRQKLMFEF